MRLRRFLRQWDLQISRIKQYIRWHKAMIRRFDEQRPENYERCIRWHKEEVMLQTARLKEYL